MNINVSSLELAYCEKCGILLCDKNNKNGSDYCDDCYLDKEQKQNG